MLQQSRRQQRGQGTDDKIWVWAMGTLVALMVLVMIIHWWRDRQPPSVRYGVNPVVAERAAGQVVLPLASAPGLGFDGGVAAIEAGAMEAFVVRLTANDYRVYSATSADGRSLRFDATAGAFVDLKDEKIVFEKSTGTQIGGDDRMPRYLCNLSVDRLEIQTVSQ